MNTVVVDSDEYGYLFCPKRLVCLRHNLYFKYSLASTRTLTWRKNYRKTTVERLKKHSD